MSCFAILHTAEVRILALVASVIRQSFHSIPLQIIIKDILRVCETLVLMKVFMLCSLESHFYDPVFESNFFVYKCLEFRIGLATYLLLTFRAVKIVKHNSRSVPLSLDLFLDTWVVHNMTTIQPDRRFLTQSWAVTNWTVIVLVGIEFRLWHSCYAVSL